MRKNIYLALLAIVLVIFIGVGATSVRNSNQKLQLHEIELKSKETKLIELNQKYDEVIQLKTETDQQKEEQLKKIQDLENERQRLERELQAKLDRNKAEQEKLATAAKKATGTQTVHAAPANGYKAFIYQKESGNRTTAVNSIGCRGLGQACPGSKLPCGDDYACQDAWFTNYAMTRYGSWEAAYNFWVANHWW